ncbi:MAG: twin-arginine translocase TatA/TatE family subunit [Myxococcales bacterium FL481]|nr:MAG: twin-arginine translocase TatA/TatE family subunit [Myxococcales bacterium FL481]
MLLAAMLGGTEIAIILLIVILVFGPSKLPQLGAGVGKMLRGFKREVKALEDEKAAEAQAQAQVDKPAESAPAGAARETIDVTPRE